MAKFKVQTHRGLQSLQSESYARPTNAKLKELFACPVQPTVQGIGIVVIQCAFVTHSYVKLGVLHLGSYVHVMCREIHI